MSRSTGPSACTSRPPALAGKRLTTPRNVTCSSDGRESPSRASRSAAGTAVIDDSLAGDGLLDVVGQERRVDDLREVHFAFERADAALHLDDALHPLEVDLPVAPIRDALRIAGRQVAHGCARDLGRDVEVLGH